MSKDTETTDTSGSYVEKGQEFNRDTNYIEDRILDDPDAQWPVEPGRYRLIAARACPWANRTVIVRRLLGLEDVISLGMPGPTHDQRSWTFDLDPGGSIPSSGSNASSRRSSNAIPTTRAASRCPQSSTSPPAWW